MRTKVLFMGTSEFAIPALQKLLDDERYEIVGVVTQPAKLAGRKKVMTQPPIKEFLDKVDNNMTVLQPERLRKAYSEILENTKPDMIIVASYGQIVPKEMLDYPEYGALNIHGSLLPILRGAVPVQMAILQGFTQTGVTIQKMVYELDEGDILAQKTINIEPNETTESLMSKLSVLGGDLLLQMLPNWVDGKISPAKQDSSIATYCYQSDISKEKAEIKFETNPELAERMSRAFYPWPVAWINIKYKDEQKRLLIYQAEVIKDQNIINDFKNVEDLKLIKVGKRLILLLQEGGLELFEVQMEGKNRNSAKTYLYLAD